MLFPDTTNGENRMGKKIVRWGQMVFVGDNYCWHPDEFIFKDEYPTISEIKFVLGVPEEQSLSVKTKRNKVYINNGKIPLCYFYRLEEEN
jgi:hypothetical protein